MGEEFNATADFVAPGPLYFSQLNWANKATNIAFYNQVKQLIAIRKQYQSIIAPGGKPLSYSNIVESTTYSGVDLPPYSMWNGDTVITVVAKRAVASGNVRFVIPVTAMGMGSYPWYQVTDLMAGTQTYYTSAQMASGLTFNLTQGGVYVLKTVGL